MVNTKSLQQVLDEIDKMLAAGSISAEEAETMKLEAKAAVAEEEEADVAEENENEDEFRDTDDVKFKETFGEDVPEVEETEEVVEETEGEDDVEEEEEIEEEEEVEEEPKLNDRQLNQLERLLKKGSKEDGTFDINNLNPKQKKRYEELISIQESDPDDVAIDTDIVNKTIKYNNGAEENAEDVLNKIKNLQDVNLPEGQKNLPGYIEREDGERLAIYEYGDNGEIIGLNPEVTDEELLKKYMSVQGENAFIEEGVELEETVIPSFLFYDENGKPIKLTQEERAAKILQWEVNNENGDKGPTIEEIYNQELQQWISNGKVKTVDGVTVIGGTDIPSRYTFDFKDIDEAIELKQRLLKDWLLQNDTAKLIIDTTKPEVDEAIVVKANEIATMYGLYNKCSVSPENCMSTIDENGVSNYEKYLLAVGNAYNREYSRLLEDNPEYNELVNAAASEFDKLFGGDESDYLVGLNSADYLKFGFDIPGIGYVPSGKAMQSMINMLGLQFDKGELAAFTRDTTEVNNTFQDSLNLIDERGLQDTDKICVAIQSKDVEKSLITEAYIPGQSSALGDLMFGRPMQDKFSGEILSTSGACKGKEFRGKGGGSKTGLFGEDLYTSKVMTVAEYKEFMEQKIVTDNVKMFEDYFSIKDSERLAEFFKTYDFSGIERGDPQAIASMLSEQSVMMGYALATMGMGPGFNQASDTLFELVELEALKRAGFDESKMSREDFKRSLSDEEFLQMFQEVADDDEFFASSQLKADLTGSAFSALEFVPYISALKFSKPMFQNLGTSILRGNLRNVLKAGGYTLVEMGKQGLREGLTEFFQELLVGHVEERDMHLYENFTTGFVAGFFLPGGISMVKQGITEIQTLASYASRLDPMSSENFYNNTLQEFDNYTSTDEYKNSSQEEKNKHIEKRKVIQNIRDANKKIPSNIIGPEREQMLDLYIKQATLEKQKLNASKEMIDEEIQPELDKLSVLIKYLFKQSKVRKTIREKSEDFEILFDDVENVEVINIKNLGKTKADQKLRDEISLDFDQVKADLESKGWRVRPGSKSNAGTTMWKKKKDGSYEFKIILNEDYGTVERRLNVGEHELGVHTLLRSTFDKNPQVAQTLANSIIQYVNKINPALLENSKFKQRLERYGAIGEDGKIILSEEAKKRNYTERDFYEEIVAIFGEALGDEIKMSDNALLDLGEQYSTVFKGLVSKIWGKEPEEVQNKLEFNSVEDIKKFFKTLAKDRKKGELSPEMVKALNEGVTGKLIEEAVSEEGIADAIQEVQGELSALSGNQKLTPEIENEVELDLQTIKELQEEELIGDAGVKTPTELLLEKKIIEAIKPTVTAVALNRARAFYDNIPADLKKNLSREDYVNSLINDGNLMVLNEWNPALDTLESFIVKRMMVRSRNAATRYGVKQNVEGDVTTLYDMPADEDINEEEQEMKRKKISPTKMLGEDLAKMAEERVIEKAKELGLDINNLTYKDVVRLRDLAAQEVAAYFGVSENKVIAGKDNLTKGEALAARMVINRDADQLLSLLPEAYSKELDTTTGVPNTLLNAFYNKGEDGIWRLRKDLKRQDFLNAFGIRTDGTFNAKSDGQIIKALMQIMNANVSIEQLSKMEGLTTQGKFTLRSGGSESLAALGPLLEEYHKTHGIVGWDPNKTPEENLQSPYWDDEKGDWTNRDMYDILFDLKKPLDELLPGINEIQVMSLYGKFLKNPEEFKNKYPKSYTIIKDYTEAIAAEKTEEGKMYSENFKIFVKKGLKLGTLTENEVLIDYLKTKGVSLLTTDDFKENHVKSYMSSNIDMARFIPLPPGVLDGNKKMIFGMLGSYGAGRIIGHENANLNDITKNGKLVRKSAKYMGDLTRAFQKQYKDYKAYKKAGGFLSEESYNRWKNFNYDALSNVYASDKLKVIEDLRNPDLNQEDRKQLILANFNEEDGQAMLNFLDLQMTTLQEWMHSVDPTSQEFGKRADHVIKLLSTSSQLSSGVRLFSNPRYFYIPDEGDEISKKKYEHLMSANEFNKTTLKLLLENKWGKTNESADVLSQYNGIYGFLDEFNAIDLQGKTNTSLIFRMGYNLDIAKKTYTLDSGLTKTVYDEIIESIGIEALQDFEGDAEAISRLNYAVAEKYGLNSLLKDFTGYEYSTNQDQVDVMSDMDNTIRIASDPEAEDKGITVADFDDTVALTNSKVVYTLPDGSTGELSAADFAKQFGNLQAQGAEFNFDQFNQVVDGKPGPMLQRIKDIAEKYGTEEVYILTARDPKSAEAIQLFLREMGLDLPLENIVGLADGTAAAKGRWVLDKTAEGYNNWYFTDDQIKNVEEVQRVLDIAARSVDGMKVDTQLSLAALSDEEVDITFNKYLEISTGIGAQKTYSQAKGKLIGKKAKTKFLNTIMPYSAEDFKGLLYTTLAPGQEGEAQFDFYKKHLIDPYNKAVSETNITMVSMSNDFRSLKKQFPNVPKTLNKSSNVSGYTVGDAMRVYMWSRDGHEIPGLSKTDQRRLIEYVENNSDLIGFSEGIIALQKNRGYPAPTENWIAGNVSTDIIGGINSINRSTALTDWQKNVDIIFSQKNLAKLEAAYGPAYIQALKGTLARMKSGKNRTPSGNPTTDNVLDWINNSVGNVMFLNTRSAALQTLSSVNFINWGDNNVVAAGKAFANQKQYWGDFMTLMNSDYLVNRREGLRINVTESEIADAVKDSKNKAKAAVAFLLNKGFVFTRYADSFAIASGGATFYRNRINTYLNEGFSQSEAEAQAFLDFEAISEETQQSADPSKISQQQASNAGRIILAFANTPMQYVRLQKRAAQDLIDGRGDWREHLSKLAYYGVAQNIVFNSMQQALFVEMFEGEDDEGEDTQDLGNRAWNIINGMSSSNLRGMGVSGAVADALKNSLITIAEESGKNSPDFRKAIDDLFDVAPPIDSKYRKLNSAANTFSWNRKDMKEIGADIDNPGILAAAQVISAFTNVPLDRALMKLNNLRNSMSDQSDQWQKIALMLGYSAWELGLPYYGVESSEEKAQKEAAYEKRKEKYQKEIKQLKKNGYKKVRKKVEGAVTVQRPTAYAKSPTIEYWVKK